MWVIHTSIRKSWVWIRYLSFDLMLNVLGHKSSAFYFASDSGCFCFMSSLGMYAGDINDLAHNYNFRKLSD